jgi:hypothetical protein
LSFLTSYGSAEWLLKWFKNQNSMFFCNQCPDLSPYDYHIFGLLRGMLCGCQFANDDEVDMVHTWLHTPKSILCRWHQKACGPKLQCVEKLRELHKKMTVYLFLCTFCKIKKTVNYPHFLKSPCSIEVTTCR